MSISSVTTFYLHTNFVSRRFKVLGKDAMGASIQHRGFSDKNLYVAYNTQQKITPVEVRSGQIAGSMHCLCTQYLSTVCV